MKKISMMVTSALMMIFCMAFAAAGSAAPAFAQDGFAEVLSMRGEITQINGNTVTVTDEQNNQSVAVKVAWNTEIRKGSNGKALSFDKLKKGDKVTAYYSPVMTRSLPPQSRGFAIVVGDGEHDGIYTKVAEVRRADGATKILSANGDIIVTIPDSVNADAKDLKPGSKVLVWYDFVALSMPGQATATKAVIL